MPIGNPKYTGYGDALEKNAVGLKHIFAASADRKDKVAAGGKSRPSYIGLPSTEMALYMRDEIIDVYPYPQLSRGWRR